MMNVRKIALTTLALLNISLIAAQRPWDNGKLTVSDNKLYLIHENGEPFFWLGNTAWLLPERLNRDEVNYYLTAEQRAGYNVEQIQVLNAIPTFNVYGAQANDENFDFSKYTGNGYGYWEHLDYIVDVAASKGIYIAMDCIWGSQIAHMDTKKAQKLGAFLGKRYKDKPNIIWMIGGDIRGDKGTESWDALARAISAVDTNHLMTFHPRRRTTSAWWFNDREWMDFNMFQSGHRRYGQRNGDGDYTIDDNTEEDNWRYVTMSHHPETFKDASESIKKTSRLMPVLDAEPSYEDIPQGLHDLNAPRWQAADVRRYAYWAVFAGCFGHTYGHNSIMQFIRPGLLASYGAETPWYDALKDPGYNQMRHLKALMLAFPFTERVADQSIIAGENGVRYDYLVATRGNDYLMVYTYTGKPVKIDLTKISGNKKKVYIFSPIDGTYTYVAEYDNDTAEIDPQSGYMNNSDRVIVAVDAERYPQLGNK